MKVFVEAVEKLAFEMRPPNAYTPRFVQLCVEARRWLAEYHRPKEERMLNLLKDCRRYLDDEKNAFAKELRREIDALLLE